MPRLDPTGTPIKQPECAFALTLSDPWIQRLRLRHPLPVEGLVFLVLYLCLRVNEAVHESNTDLVRSCVFSHVVLLRVDLQNCR
jgi:hypothetical protein